MGHRWRCRCFRGGVGAARSAASPAEGTARPQRRTAAPPRPPQSPSCHRGLGERLAVPCSARRRFLLLFWEPVSSVQDAELFSCSAPSSRSHRCRSAQPGRYQHAPGSCCNPTSDQAEFKPVFPARFQTEKWESSGTSVPKADTFLSRLKDKILFLMSGISPGLCSPLPGGGRLGWPKRTEGHSAPRGPQPGCPMPAWCSPSAQASGAGSGHQRFHEAPARPRGDWTCCWWHCSPRPLPSTAGMVWGR